jgi:hypothetical protein
MKIPHLLASLALSTTASAAELKDPGQVAADWNRTMDEARQPVLAPGQLGLGPAPAGPLDLTPPAVSRPPRPRRNGDVIEIPPDLRMDPGILKIIPGAETPPRGAKPWYYRGQKFWLIPLTRPGDDEVADPGPRYDAPNYRVPRVLPDQKPPGTKPDEGR